MEVFAGYANIVPGLKISLTPTLAGGLFEDHRSLNRFLGTCFGQPTVYFLIIILNFIFTNISEYLKSSCLP